MDVVCGHWSLSSQLIHNLPALHQRWKCGRHGGIEKSDLNTKTENTITTLPEGAERHVIALNLKELNGLFEFLGVKVINMDLLLEMCLYTMVMLRNSYIKLKSLIVGTWFS